MPKMVPARLPGGVSGMFGCGRVGAVFLALAMVSPRSFKAGAAQLGANLGEVVRLLFLDVVADVLDDPVHDIALLDVGAVTRFLESLEEAFDGFVVVLEKGDCVHGGGMPECSRR